jgi:poly-gamma-glutamate capsule biosynthesis protein CapA/YwtB (metallophosphatase superfamily)
VSGLLGLVVTGASTCGPPSPPLVLPARPTAEVNASATLMKRPKKIRVLVAGDVMPHRPMLSPPDRLHEAVEPLGPLFASADIAVANYETSTGDPRGLPVHAPMGSPVVHDMSLVATPSWLGAAGEFFHAVTVANNHACDLGRRGLEATLEAARDEHVMALGGDETTPWQPRVLVEKDGRRVCAVAWTTFVNSEARACPASGKLAIAGLDPAGMRTVAEAISGAVVSGCDATLAIFHGGTEYETHGSSVLAQARVAAEAGADAVVMHHPHVPLPVELYETKDGRKVPIFASVGNLVSNQGESYRPALPTVSPEHFVSLNGWTRLGVIADLEWAWPGEGHERPSLAYGYHLVWTENEHSTNRSEPMPRIVVRLLDPTEGRRLIDRLSTDPDGPTRLFHDPCWLEQGVTRCAPPPAPRAAPRSARRLGPRRVRL